MNYAEFKHRIYAAEVPRPAAIWFDDSSGQYFAEYVEALTHIALDHILRTLEIPREQTHCITSTKTILIIKPHYI